MTIQLTPGEDWFKLHELRWEAVVKPVFQDREYCRALEIGTWEGGSAYWILKELCAGNDEKNELVCIDHFDLMKSVAGKNRWKTFQKNIQSTGFADKVRVIREFSTPALFKLMREISSGQGDDFNLVYIDGSHRADDTLLDAEISWRMAAEKCILIFDDYEWDQATKGTIKHPKLGIDAFLKVHRGEYTLLDKSYQIVIQKEIPMRLGFLLEENI